MAPLKAHGLSWRRCPAKTQPITYNFSFPDVSSTCYRGPQVAQEYQVDDFHWLQTLVLAHLQRVYRVQTGSSIKASTKFHVNTSRQPFKLRQLESTWVNRGASTMSVEMMYRCMQQIKTMPHWTIVGSLESTNKGPRVSHKAHTALKTLAALVRL